jgi:hypothetical protein
LRSERFRLDFPPDFPVAELDAVDTHLSASKTRRESAEWSEWAAACNGIGYRFLACDEHALALGDSLAKDIAPPPPERYRQERLLFSFFAEGLSCIECFYYGFHFVGAMIDSGVFNPRADPRTITTQSVVRRYVARFATEQLTESLQAVTVSADLTAWRDVRNILAHRSSPGRGLFVGGPREGQADWLGESLSRTAIRARRSWLADAVVGLVEPAVAFVRQQV